MWNTTFKNTNITGATLTGITFSNLQKGQLLLRLENLSNTAVNNLTSLTIQELRIVQPTISLRSLNTIQGVTVIVPNNTGQGYFVAVTPNINQVICIFAATNQNIILTSSGNIVKTVRNTGTVIQDIDNANATISYIKIGSVSYRFSIGNSDGVIAMIPIDTNLVRVNDAGINDIISLNTVPTTTTSCIGYSWNFITDHRSVMTAKVNFSNLHINMLTNRIRGVIHIKLGSGDFGYPILFFNNTHSYPSSATNTNELSRSFNITHSSTWSNQSIYANANTSLFTIYQDGSPCFANVAFPNVSSVMTIKFDVDLQKQKNNILRQIICSGEWTWTSKLLNSAASYIYHGYFNRISEIRPISAFLVSSYNFDNNVNDTSTNGNTLTNVGTVTFNTSDFIRGGAAASFNGSNHFEISNDGRFSPDNFTVACWIKPVDSAGNVQSIATCRDGITFKGWMIYIGPSNTLEFITGSGSGWSGPASYGSDLLLNIQTNTWVHIAFTLSKSTNTVVVYINGNLQKTITRTYANNTSYRLRIGAGGDSTNGELFVRNGTLIDDFNLFNKVLTSSEIANVYSSTSPVVTDTFLVSSYNFDSNPNDSSPNLLNYTNTLTNVATVTYNTSDFMRGNASASFNGSNYFEVSNDGRFSPAIFTVACWIKPKTHSTSYQAIASCRASSPWSGWMLYIGPDNVGSSLEIWSSSNGSDFTGQTSLYNNFGRLNRWVHIAFTLIQNTSALIVYIDGVAVTTTTLGYTRNLSTNLRIGAGSNETTGQIQVVNGTLIDDFRIYNKVLTPAEIRILYAGTTAPVSFNNNITLNDIGIGGYGNSTPAIEQVTMNLEVIGLPSF